MKATISVGRVLIAVIVIALAGAGYTAWLIWQTQRDLQDADGAIRRLQTAVASGDRAGRDGALADLEEATAAAERRTGSAWWAGMEKFPVLGDDLEGVAALSASISLIAAEAVEPLVRAVDSLRNVVRDGKVDLNAVAELQTPVSSAAAAVREAELLVSRVDSTKFTPALRVRFDDYRGRVRELSSSFQAADQSVEMLPDILGAGRARNYLFVFQNNAEVRSTGGLPGSWAQVRAVDGRLRLLKQGSANDFNTGSVVTALTDEEQAVYGELPALYFQDPNFIPDFPRAAELFNAFWTSKYPTQRLDGVVSLDVVAMSYLLEGLGPIQLDDGVTLTPQNLTEELLSNTYREIPEPARQDRRFRQVTTRILSVATTGVASPLSLVEGFARAADERRFLFAPLVPDEKRELERSKITGALSGDNGRVPHVDIGVNDATGSKMSFYLRYNADVRSQGCVGNRQQLAGEVNLRQTISPSDAEGLPDYVTGGGEYGVPVGNQLVTLRIYGPFGGSIADVRVDGRRLDVQEGQIINGRPVVTIAPIIDTLEDVVVTWRMLSGEGQVEAGKLGLTPSVVAGTLDREFRTGCTK